MATQVFDETTKVDIRRAIEMMDEIYTIVKDKHWVDWENDSNRFLVLEKMVRLSMYLKLTGLLRQIDDLYEFDRFLWTKEEPFKLYFMQLEFPKIINTLQSLC